jgi:type I restriction enzyme S subunit
VKNGLLKKLEDVCNVEYGIRVVQKRDGGKGYPVYGGGSATFEMKIFNRENRLVIARFGMSEKCTRIVPGKFFLNDSGLTVSSKNELMNQRFLDYQILSLNDDIFKLGKGTAQKNLDVAAFRTLHLFVPPLAEQKRIVAKLDEAFAGLAKAKENAEKNLQNARALFESYLESVFTQRGPGWVETTIGEVCDFRGGGTPSKAVERYWKGKIPWVSPKDMKSEIVSDSIDHISQEAIDGSATSLIPKGAVLMVVRSGILARIVPLAVTGRELTINQDLKALCPKSVIETRFLYNLLESKMPELLSLISRGATVHRLQTEKIRSLQCILPPKTEQNKLSARIDSLREETQRLARIYEQKLEALESLKKSILHEAFSGNL